MKELEMTAANYLKQIRLGYFEPIKCIGLYKKVVRKNNLNGTTEELIINLKR